MIVNAKAYMDDSGSTKKSPICVVGGFVATAEVWEQFSENWQITLRRKPPIEYFRMNEAERCKGQFAGWRQEDCEEKVIALAHVILQADPLLLDAVIQWSDYLTLVGGRLLQEIDHPFFAGFHTVIGKMAHEKRTGAYPHVVDFIFDNGSPFAITAQKFYIMLRERAQRVGDAGLISTLGATPVFQDDKKLLPLQAADLLAWQIRRKLDDTLPENTSPGFMRPALQLLDQLAKVDMFLGDRELSAYAECFSSEEPANI